MPEFKFHTLPEYEKIVNKMAEAMKNGKLVFFIGAGISRIQGYPSWDEYIDRLIKYWESHINDDPAMQKSRVYVNALDQILSSNIDKKRKVDLVHQMIKQAFGQEMFEERQLDFEKYYFESLPPITEYNPVLTKLANLDASYITTNYDNQIEKHLDNMKTVSATVTDIEDFDERTDQVSLNTVIHLHGMPSGRPEHFISSSSSYKKHYYSDFQPISKIRHWIDKKNLLLVFLGSSMEEDEILSLLSGINGDHVSFLASNHGEDETGDCIRKITEEYHSDQNHTHVFWYDDDYNMLPSFVAKLVNDIRNVAYPESNDDWYQFRDAKTPHAKIINILNQTEFGILEHYFDGLNPEIITKRVPQILSSDIFESPDKNIPASIWKVLETNHKGLSPAKIDSIINYISGQNSAYRIEAAVSFLRRLKLSEEQTLNLEKSLGSKPDIEYLDFYDWPNVMGWFLVKEIKKHSYQEGYYDTENPLTYNLVPQAQEELINILNSDDFKLIILESAADIIDDGGFSQLFHAILDDKFKIANKSWESKIDKRLLCHPIFIKILMKVNEKKKLSEHIVSQIISNVDFSDKNLGFLFNNFCTENHSEIIQLRGDIEKVQYEDGMTFGGVAKEVQQISFVTEKDLALDNDSVIVKKLTRHENNGVQFGLEDDLFEQSAAGTTNFFKKILVNPETTVANRIVKLFTDNIQQLYNEYKDWYCWYLFEESSEVKSDNDMVHDVIKMYSDNKISKFDYYDAQILKNLLNSDYFVAEASTAFWQIDSSDFDLPYPDKNKGEEFTYNHFINSSLGSYLDLFKFVVEKVPDSKEVAQQKINDIEDDNIRHFMMGRHYGMYKDNRPKTIYDLKGISSAYRLGNKGTGAFKDATLFALHEGYNDPLIEQNVAIIALHEINPSEDSITWDKINVYMIFRYIFYTDYDFPHQHEWLKEIMTRQANKYCAIIFRMFRKNSESSKVKLGKLLSNPEKVLELISEKISINLVTSTIDEIDENLQSLFLRILTLIISSGRIKINGTPMQTIEMVLELSEKEERAKLFSGLRTSMDPGDLSRLETKYSTI
ncbi:SIR2-like domain-containing protein [Leuconostoc gasicomitatum]|uniref:SIR2 family protein n=1 Tax=Leuconostoc gasicomitatum TaxID=115778 RepID=UPI000BCA8E79|nr:SIR2 family protein [Leuconostoc gasicomitatum]MBZ5967231.1 SIR2 family protein [Leuconostoc gasicomitatum]SOB97632.1 conserved hypothetical protein [Leuconostoc gasicomitatum]